jgi:hypothetical protein
VAFLKIEHRIGVMAPADVIWESMADLSTWAEWNPLYPRAHGQVRIGETLELDLAIPGQPKQVIRPKILDWAPNDHIHWELRMLGGLVKSVRYLEIEALEGAPGVIVSNGEIFRGLLGPRLVQRQRKAIRRGFEAMGEALKARAEAALAGRQGELDL